MNTYTQRRERDKRTRRRARVGASRWTKSSSQSGSLPTFLGETLREGPERLKGKTERRRQRQRRRSFYLCQQPGAAQKTDIEKSDGPRDTNCAREPEQVFQSWVFLHVGVNSSGAQRPEAAGHVATPSPSALRGEERNGIRSQPFRCTGIPAGAQLSQNTARVEEGLFPFKLSSH